MTEVNREILRILGVPAEIIIRNLPNASPNYESKFSIVSFFQHSPVLTFQVLTQWFCFPSPRRVLTAEARGQQN